ncbi:DUF4255 domain-containing protein [Actinokineospora sp. 24-640]
MLHHIDAALVSLVRSALPEEVDVRVEPPTRKWALTVSDTVVSLFPHRIEEDVEARASTWTNHVDARGRVLARVLPPRRYRFCYLLTAWSDSRRAEHEVLGTVLSALAGHVWLPPADLAPDMPVTGQVGIDVAHPNLPAAGEDLWSALGIPPRGHLDVVVTATMAPATVTALTPPPEEVVLGVGQTVPGGSAESTPGGRPTRRIQE